MWQCESMYILPLYATPVMGRAVYYPAYLSTNLTAMPATTSSLRHVVLFSFKNNATSDQVDGIIEGFARLPEAIPGILSYEWGTNVSPEGLNDGFTHCFTLTFGANEDRDNYLTHPAHQAFVATLGACLERSLVLDYWTQ
jgi:hypothetical protein